MKTLVSPSPRARKRLPCIQYTVAIRFPLCPDAGLGDGNFVGGIVAVIRSVPVILASLPILWYPGTVVIAWVSE